MFWNKFMPLLAWLKKPATRIHSTLEQWVRCLLPSREIKVE